MKRISGVILLALYLLLVFQKTQAGLAAELLWLSHVTSAVLAIGLLVDVPLMIAAGFLFHLAVALPAYLFYLGTGGETSLMSFLLHALSPLFGAMACRAAPLPRRALMLTYAIYAVVIGSTLAFTPAAMNVNSAFKHWASLNVPGTLPLLAANAVQMLLQTGAAFLVWNRLSRKAA
ncbi:hypothetical protein [Massilia sp. TSP1-1-2]|uniref:hypothetical protein n=1 Tax=unclassified Massilia TaxID=2609279 RepID=UPI003CE67AC1